MDIISGKGKAHASLSILNAIPTGIGAAIPIKLTSKSNIEIIVGGHSGEDGFSIVNGEKKEINEKVLMGIRFWLEKIVGKNIFLNVKIKSGIPVGVGLKSSSALITSILTGINNALKLGLDEIKIAKKCVEISKNANLTITGGFDDCISTITDKIIVTNNHENKIIKTIPTSSLPVWIIFPKTEKRADIATLKKLRVYFKKAVEELFNDNIKHASLINGFLTSLAISRSIVNNFVKLISTENVLLASVSGRGPATYIASKDVSNLPPLFANSRIIRTYTIETGEHDDKL